jgi:hypothetical protein
MKRTAGLFLVFFLCVLHLGSQALVNPVKLPRKSLNFIVSNDMGRRGVSYQKDIAALMGQEADFNVIRFVAVAGDPIHDNGVRSVDDSEWTDKYESIYTANSLIKIPWYVVSGNHEYHGNVQAVLDYSGVSERWEAPARYFAIEKPAGRKRNRCLLVFIDTPPLIDKYRNGKSYSDAGKQDLDKQLRWIDSTLFVSKARWKIVIGHHPVYADTDKDESERSDMQKRVGTILENRKADAYICGHIHNFQHIKPEGKTVSYIVNSSASSSRKVINTDGTIFCNPDPGFTVCSVTRDSFSFHFLNNKGETVYNYSITK